MTRFRDERGSTTLWTLGLALSLLMLGGISIDLWSALGAHRDLAGIADAAAVAAASGVDTERFRNDGVVRLDEGLAEGLALSLIAAQPNGADLSAAPVVVVAADGQSVTVDLQRRVNLTLLRLLVADGSIVVGATATSDASLRQ
ncbi:MAG: pilus assembly protein TadG-related protein [Acidimicrobiia bacterium]|nr:pilus assembly protein TadG-related protein [Acidimicrobiia bacterium]MDH4309039.1 pilus assembly protein TadG-related protein [Acidimicrobiia bacterium]